MLGCFDLVKHTVITPYDKTILPITPEEVNLHEFSNAYDMTDAVFLAQFNHKIKSARALFEKYYNVPLLYQEEEVLCYINNAELRMPLAYPYIESVISIQIKTIDKDVDGNYIWFTVPVSDYSSTIISAKHYYENEIYLRYNANNPAINTDPRFLQNCKIRFTRGMAGTIDDIPINIKNGLLKTVKGWLDGSIAECSSTNAILTEINPYFAQTHLIG